MLSTLSTTLSVAVAFTARCPFLYTVISVLPPPVNETKPLLSTVATVSSDETHTSIAEAFEHSAESCNEPSVYSAIFVSGIPDKIIVSVIVRSSFTVINASALICELLLSVAVITTAPLSINVILPLSSIVATSSSPDFHCTPSLPLVIPSCKVLFVSVIVAILFSGKPVIVMLSTLLLLHATANTEINAKITINIKPLILFLRLIFLDLLLDLFSTTENISLYLYYSI